MSGPRSSRVVEHGSNLLPGEAGTLGPAEAIDDFIPRLGVRFDAARPGIYGLRIRFTAESGLGEGESNLLIFPLPAPAQVQSLPERVPPS